MFSFLFGVVCGAVVTAFVPKVFDYVVYAGSKVVAFVKSKV